MAKKKLAPATKGSSSGNRGPQVSFKVIELTAPSPAHDMTEEEGQAVASLATHPGFQYLTNKLKLSKSYMESRLKTEKHPDIRQVDNLQNGIRWAGWLETQVEFEVNRRGRRPERPAMPIEEEEFKRVASFLEIVGK